MIAEFRRQFDFARDPTTALNALGYAEGTWTPTVTFATPGDLSVVYSGRSGRFTKLARIILAQFDIVTTTFTYTTASGNFQITGLPFTAAATYRGGGCWSQMNGFTGFSAGTSYLNPNVQPNTKTILMAQMGATNTVFAAIGNFTTGTNLVLRGYVQYTM